MLGSQCRKRDDDATMSTHHHKHQKHDSDGRTCPKAVVPVFLPYIAGVTERNERVCRPLGIRVICGDRGKMREALVKVKQPTPKLHKTGVIYEVPCGECNHVYIGKTERTLRKRLTKHKAAVKRCDNKNGIAVHAWKSGHQVECLPK